MDEVRVFGDFIVADPRICHGQLTFRGTRILVATVLEQIAEGLTWETIVEQWEGDVTSEAISEAVRLAQEVLVVSVRDTRLDGFVLERRAG